MTVKYVIKLYLLVILQLCISIIYQLGIIFFHALWGVGQTCENLLNDFTDYLQILYY